MGYRSDIVIALTDNATRLLKAIIDHLPKDHEVHSLMSMDSGNFIEIPPCDFSDKNKDCESRLVFEGVKWYDSHEDVSLIEEILEYIDDENWLLTRVGEDQEDCEQRGCYYDSNVYIRRTIEW
ncbi:MAG: hypothetical protein CMA72_09175 [Euryarchaeota archaeon]|nr:hypothetical protein [Euryarchaeota archaeon]|tara:strand:- start:218 stop:586 length:369 start_codon:yes stop_codon:yes gene_type:complete